MLKMTGFQPHQSLTWFFVYYNIEGFMVDRDLDPDSM